MAVFRQDIIKQITSRPGQVVYRRDIEEDLGLTSSQVSAAVLNFQNSSPMGSEVETVMRGSAWRFVPNQPIVTTNGQETPVDPDLPLTTMIRNYLIRHPHEPIWVADLARYSGHDDYQVKVGINNMRRIQANGDITPHLVTEIRGQCWRFDPPPGWRPRGPSPATQRETRSTPRPVPVAAAVTPTPSSDSDDVEVRRFEEVGTAGDAIIIRDDDGNMFRAVPLT